MRTSRFALAALVSTSVVAQAHAAIAYLGSSRRVTASMGSVSDSQMAFDNAPWSATASATSGPNLATLSSSQTSSFAPSGILATGVLTYSRQRQDLTTGVAGSSLAVFFTLDEDTPYTLTGSVPGSTGTIALINAGSVIHSGTVLNVSGVLPAGMYQFSADITLSAPQTGPGSIPWKAQFAVPSPAGVCALGAWLLTTVRRRRV